MRVFFSYYEGVRKLYYYYLYMIQLTTLKTRRLISCFLLGAIMLTSLSVLPRQTKAMTDSEKIIEIQRLIVIVQGLMEQLEAMGGSIKIAPAASFSEPVIYGSTNSSVALLQKILATDPAIYPEGKVTGYFGDLTVSALRRFQIKHGLVVTGTFSAETRAVLESLLKAVPLASRPSNYLLDSSVVTQISLAKNSYQSSFTIMSQSGGATTRPVSNQQISIITVFPNTRDNTSKITVYYSDGKSESFTLNVAQPISTIETMLASRLKRTTTEIQKVIQLVGSGSSVSKQNNEPKKIVVTIYDSMNMDLDVLLEDGSQKEEKVGPLEVSEFVMFVYGGNFERYNEEFNQEIYHPLVVGSPIVVQKVAAIIGGHLNLAIGSGDMQKIASILEVKLDKKSSDPCFETSGYNCTDS